MPWGSRDGGGDPGVSGSGDGDGGDNNFGDLGCLRLSLFKKYHLLEKTNSNHIKI